MLTPLLFQILFSYIWFRFTLCTNDNTVFANNWCAITKCSSKLQNQLLAIFNFANSVQNRLFVKFKC